MDKWLVRILGPVLPDKLGLLGVYASALAYGFVLSIIPFLLVTFILATHVAPKHVDLRAAYAELISDIFPQEVAQLPVRAAAAAHPPGSAAVPAPAGERGGMTGSSAVVATLEKLSHGGVATIGFILAAYTSFNLMSSIVRTFLFVFNDPRRPEEWNWLANLKSLAVLFIWILVLFLIFTVLVLSPIVENILRQLGIDPRLWTAPLALGRNVGLIAALFGAFFLTYLLVPTRRYPVPTLLGGSLVSTLGWILSSLVFSRVMPAMWKASPVYEALGSIVVVLLWAQACAWSMILGACWIVRFAPERGAGRRGRARGR